MKAQSAKAKGRKLQQDVAKKIREKYNLSDNDVKSTSMGVSGIDVQLSDNAREKFPYAVECKSYARIAIYNWYNQANTNREELTPLLIVKQNRSKPLVVIDLDDFLDLVK